MRGVPCERYGFPDVRIMLSKKKIPFCIYIFINMYSVEMVQSHFRFMSYET